MMNHITAIKAISGHDYQPVPAVANLLSAKLVRGESGCFVRGGM